MLFDLRRRGRRRTVKVIYLGLALLIGLGLVGFGIGTGGGNGGLLNAFSEESRKNGSVTYEKDVAAAIKRTRADPTDAGAWESLTSAELHEASVAPNYDSTTGRYSASGKELLQRTLSAWQEYLKLKPNDPSPELALHMLSVLGEGGLNKPEEAVRALQIVIPSQEPSAALYSDLAEYSFKAKLVEQGNLAMSKAIELAPKTERKVVKEELESDRAKALGSTTPTGPTGSSIP